MGGMGPGPNGPMMNGHLMGGPDGMMGPGMGPGGPMGMGPGGPMGMGPGGPMGPRSWRANGTRRTYGRSYGWTNGTWRTYGRIQWTNGTRRTYGKTWTYGTYGSSNGHGTNVFNVWTNANVLHVQYANVIYGRTYGARTRTWTNGTRQHVNVWTRWTNATSILNRNDNTQWTRFRQSPWLQSWHTTRWQCTNGSLLSSWQHTYGTILTSWYGRTKS